MQAVCREAETADMIDMGKALRLLPFFIFFSAFLFPQTELDARTIAAMYGRDYVSVPERETVNFPALLEGIWTGGDRYVFFVPNGSGETEKDGERAALRGETSTEIARDAQSSAGTSAAAQSSSKNAKITSTDIALILKTYYGWFYDRAAEPEAFASQSERFLCTATT